MWHSLLKSRRSPNSRWLTSSRISAWHRQTSLDTSRRQRTVRRRSRRSTRHPTPSGWHSRSRRHTLGPSNSRAAPCRCSRRVPHCCVTTRGRLACSGQRAHSRRPNTSPPHSRWWRRADRPICTRNTRRRWCWCNRWCSPGTEREHPLCTFHTSSQSNLWCNNCRKKKKLHFFFFFFFFFCDHKNRQHINK